MNSELAVTVTRNFDHSAESVFDALLDADRARNFMFATESGEMVKAEIDASIGGSYVFTEDRPGEGEVEHTGVYLDIDRPSRLMFTFTVAKHGIADDLVTIEISPRGKGCVLSLTHEVKPEWAARKDDLKAGWAGILGLLDSTLSNASDSGETAVRPKDSNGTVLSEGDSVTVIKDLDVKGSSITLKRGTLIKNIHLVDDEEVIECRVGGSTLVLKTCFLKKA